MRILTALAILLLGADHATAQELRVEGAEGDTAVVLLRQILDGGDYLLIDRDTTLAATSTIQSDVLIIDARVSLEGSILGSVAVIRGDFFIRPRARVTGSIVVVDGGAYGSALAEMGEIYTIDPRVQSELETGGGGFRLALTQEIAGILRIPGLLGFRIPSYDRVDGLSVGWGGGLGFGGDTASISLLGSATYRTERERAHGSVALQIRPSFRGRIVLSAARDTRTNESWIRGTLPNTLSSLLGHSDVRNYYETDILSATIAALPPPPLIEGESYISPRATLRLSRDRSVPTGDVWSLFNRDEPWRDNPAIDGGVLGSVIAGAAFGWRGITTTAAGDAAVEYAPSGIGDFEFAQLSARAEYQAIAFPGQQLGISGYVRYPLGSGSVPRQRWTMLGGPGTLPTLDTGSLIGDHALFVRGAYSVLFPAVTLPVVGSPILRAEYAAGTAWAADADIPPIEQNVGAGIQLMIFTGMLYVDPSQEFDPVFSFGARIPAGGSAPEF